MMSGAFVLVASATFDKERMLPRRLRYHTTADGDCFMDASLSRIKYQASIMMMLAVTTCFSVGREPCPTHTERYL